MRQVKGHGMVCPLSWLASGLLFLMLLSGVAHAQSSSASEGVNAGPMPVNAYTVSNGWRCRTGFTLSEGRCDPVVAPANAIVAGNGWRCMPGFARNEDVCERLVPPA